MLEPVLEAVVIGGTSMLGFYATAKCLDVMVESFRDLFHILTRDTSLRIKAKRAFNEGLVTSTSVLCFLMSAVIAIANLKSFFDLLA